MTPEVLASAAGILLSLIFTYIPGLNRKFAAWDPSYQRLVMIGALAVIAGGAFGLSCAKLFAGTIPVVCTDKGAQDLVITFVLSVIANQATYSISPKPAAVTVAKAARKA